MPAINFSVWEESGFLNHPTILIKHFNGIYFTLNLSRYAYERTLAYANKNWGDVILSTVGETELFNFLLFLFLCGAFQGCQGQRSLMGQILRFWGRKKSYSKSLHLFNFRNVKHLFVQQTVYIAGYDFPLLSFFSKVGARTLLDFHYGFQFFTGYFFRIVPSTYSNGSYVLTLGVSPSLVSRWREGYSFWSSWGP